MSEIEVKNAGWTGPRDGEIAAFIVNLTNTIIDLTTTNVADYVTNGDFITVQVDPGTQIYYKFSNDPAGVVDPNAVSGPTQAIYLGPGQVARFQIPRTSRGPMKYFIARATGSVAGVRTAAP